MPFRSRYAATTSLLLSFSVIACSGSDSNPGPATGVGGVTGTTPLAGGATAVGSGTISTVGGVPATTGAGGAPTSTTSSTPATTLGGATSTGGAATLGGATSAGTTTAKGGSTSVGGTAAKGGATSVGGATSTGGTTAKGGTTSVGGTTAKGGSTSVGGTTAKGGTTSAGGTTSTGGTTAKGGTTSVGGTTSAGGTTAKGGTTSTGGSSSGVCTPPKAGTSKSNPLFTDVYTADPAVMVDNCTFYIACGHDQGTGGFDLREWYLLKSTDMVNWTRSTPMKLNTFAWTNANAWAGQMIHAKNGKFYWYVPINNTGNDRMAIGVAVANSPEGPWTDALGKPLVDDALEMSTFGITNIDQTPHTIDPTVFIDDDGQAYLQYGGFWSMVTAKLNADMISFAGKLTMTTPPNYFESPYLIKRNNIYYEIYAAGSANPTTIDYATSSSPMGPWTRKGTILGIMPQVAGQDYPTNHAGVGQFAGQWYIVYHVSNGPNGGGTYKREVAVDKMTFNADGSINPVTPSAALTF